MSDIFTSGYATPIGLLGQRKEIGDFGIVAAGDIAADPGYQPLY